MVHARTTDPTTSHEAAQSVRNETLTQRVILSILTISPLTDEELVNKYQAMQRGLSTIPRASASGIRSRRNELAQAEKVFPVGYKKTESGRKAIVWGL